MKKYIFILFSIFCLHDFALAQEGPVFWLHGFQFEPIPTTDPFPGRWDLYSQHYEGRNKLISTVPNYAKTNYEVEGGLSNAAYVLEKQLASGESNGILIGHSMGGLVARKVANNSIKTVDGIVTVGSAHGGALIAKNIDNGNLLKTAKEGYEILSKGPGSNALLWGVKIVSGGEISVFTLADLLWRRVLSKGLMEELPRTGSQTLADLKPNSAFLNDLNANHNASVPIINIVLKEVNHEVLRMGASTDDKPENYVLHRAPSDNKYNAKRTEVESWYKGFKDKNLAYRFLSPFTWAYYNSRANAYREGEVYLDHGFEKSYDLQNGGTSLKSKTDYRMVRVCKGTYSGSELVIDALPLPDGCNAFETSECEKNCEWVSKPYTVYYYADNDQDGLNATKVQEMPNDKALLTLYTEEVNHMEIGNNYEITRHLNSIFNLKGTNFHREIR